MLTVAIRRCTTQKNRGFAFGLYYSIMNVAALASGPVVDGFNIGFPNGIHVGNRNLSGNRFVILSCSLSTFVSLLVALFILKDIKVVETDDASVAVIVSSNPLHASDVDTEGTYIYCDVCVYIHISITDMTYPSQGSHTAQTAHPSLLHQRIKRPHAKHGHLCAHQRRFGVMQH